MLRWRGGIWTVSTLKTQQQSSQTLLCLRHKSHSVRTTLKLNTSRSERALEALQRQTGTDSYRGQTKRLLLQGWSVLRVLRFIRESGNFQISAHFENCKALHTCLFINFLSLISIYYEVYGGGNTSIWISRWRKKRTSYKENHQPTLESSWSLELLQWSDSWSKWSLLICLI